MKKYKILVVDDESLIRTMLCDYLEVAYTVSSAENGMDALALCTRERFDLVISDINMPGMKGPKLLHEIKKQYPETKIMLITAYNVDDYIRVAKEYGITNIIPKTVPFNYDELGVVIDGLLTENIFGIERYLLADQRIERTYCIKSSEEAKTVRENVTQLIAAKFGSSGDVKLIMDEMITNAIYHAPTNENGIKKYEEYMPVQLEPSEYVYVSYGFDSEKYGIAVIDNQGRLKKETVLYKIDRHLRGEGMLDDSGRGIHMSRLFADRLIINIHPHAKTEVIFMNYFLNKYSGYKPLCINEI
jgi:CheY-like chemotaxis protein